MNEVILKNISDMVNFLLRDGGDTMMTAGMQIAIGAVALILVLLLARLKSRNFRGRHGTHYKVNQRASSRLFEKKLPPERKPCPNCAEQLPLSAIICNKCDYNFLAARPGRGQNLLPSPEAPIHEVFDQKVSSTGL